ncbi:CAP domain-containing protein [Streptomyces sp. L7]
MAANSSLTTLAENFSQQMADQDFFDHTDPSGATPWDRAESSPSPTSAARTSPAARLTRPRSWTPG